MSALSTNYVELVFPVLSTRRLRIPRRSEHSSQKFLQSREFPSPAAAMASIAGAAAMAAQFASMSLASPSTSASASLTSPFTGNATLLSLRRRAVAMPVVRPRNVTVQAKGGFIPAEHRWMYEGIEKMGPVRIFNTLFSFSAPCQSWVFRQSRIFSTLFSFSAACQS